MKSIALLAIALFLASAPAPDSDFISEVSGGFLVIPNARSLMAAEISTDTPTAPSRQPVMQNVLPAANTPSDLPVSESRDKQPL